MTLTHRGARRTWSVDVASFRLGGKLPNAWGLHDMLGTVCFRVARSR